MAVFVTNPRHRRRSRRHKNGAVNILVAKKIGADIRTVSGREAVKAFKKTDEYKAWSKGAAKAIATERAAKKSRTASSKAYTKQHGESRVVAFLKSKGVKLGAAKRGKGRRSSAAAAAAPAAAPAAKRGGRKAAAASGKGKTGVVTSAKGVKMHYLNGRLVSKAKYDAAMAGKGAAAAPVKRTRKASGKKAAAGKVKASSAKRGKGRGKGKAKKNPYGFFRRTNGAVQDAVGFVKERAFTMDGLMAAGMAAAVGAAHYYAAPRIESFLVEQGGKIPVVGEYVAKGAEMAPYTITGLLAGAVLTGIGFATGRSRLGVTAGALAASSGVVLDVVRGLTSREESRGGDKAGIEYNGLAYSGLAYSGVEVMSNPGYGGVMAVTNPGYGADENVILEYGDAQEADAYMSGDDFADDEGQALMDGPRAFFMRFGPPPRVASRVKGAYSRHAGRPGHRWAWLIKLVGFRRAQDIAALPPERRLQVISALREQAVSSLPALMSRQAALPAPTVSPYTTLMSDAQAAGGASGYGALVYAGAGY